MSYYNELIKFLNQAKTGNLKTKDYEDEYLGTEVKVSFGQGTPARIPWISFLKKPNTTSNGIYPVYLYYKDQGILILAYGISETKQPISTWDIKEKVTISSYFAKNFKQKPDRYGDSCIYKVYKVDSLPSKGIIESDLKNLIEIYLHTVKEMGLQNDLMTAKPAQSEFSINKFQEALAESGLYYPKRLSIRLISSLLTKPFVILTGLAGSGKTKLAQAFIKWICEGNKQYLIIPVGADWTNREPLLGYPNALNPAEYVKPDSGVLDLIIQANQHPEFPHFLILDEMNLSHVERYFADFLSTMESKEEIPLYPEGSVENGVPAKLFFPSNLFIIGTVNIDETTNMFSPKVLDRANTIEFRVTAKEMEEFLSSRKEINMDSITGHGADMAANFLQMAKSKTFALVDSEEINKTLIKFFGELKKTGAEFGYRSATEILRLIYQLDILDKSMTTNEKLDIAIMQKLLPKLHGSRRKLCPILETLGGFCISENRNLIKDVFENREFDFNSTSVLYPLSLEKISRMYNAAIDNGFASFAEA